MSSFPAALPAPDITPLRGGPLLRWGVLAPGGIAQDWVSAVHSYTDQRVVAVASRSLEKAQDFAALHGIDRAYGDYGQLAEDPGVDIVYVAAPHSEHLRLALLAIAAGNHVLVEKPIALSAAEAQQIVDAARTAGVFAMEATWSRFLPQTSVVSQLIGNGDLGEVLSIVASMGGRAPFDPTSRLFDPALGGGALLDIGVYPAWLAQFVLGEPSRVVASGSLAPTGVDAQAALILEYEGSAAQSVLTTSLIASTSWTATISGTAARIEYTGPFMAPSSFRLVAGDQSIDWSEPDGFVWRDGLCYQATAVAQHVADGLTESPLHSLDDTLAIMRVVDAARMQLGAK